jgi:hypothetical protein
MHGENNNSLSRALPPAFFVFSCKHEMSFWRVLGSRLQADCLLLAHKQKEAWVSPRFLVFRRELSALTAL